MDKLNRRVPPPWGDDMEEALRAQDEALRRQPALSPSDRRSLRSRLFLKLGIALALLCFLCAFLGKYL
jgi:type VI protein secretion system component VasF